MPVKELAGMVKAQLAALEQGLVPMVSLVAVYVPLEALSVTVPVGGAPEPETDTVTLRLVFEFSVNEAGVTVIVGVDSAAVSMVT